MGCQSKYTVDDIRRDFQNKGYTLISDIYKNQNEKLEYVCDKHKDYGIQKVSYYSFLKNKHNCAMCHKEYVHNTWHEKRNFVPIMHDEFYKKHFDKYKDKLFDVVQDEYSLIDVFKKNRHVYMKLRHNVCGTTYNVESHHFFSRNQRCPNQECNSKIRSISALKPKDQLLKEIYDLVGNEYKLIGEYLGTNIKTIFYHSVCGNTFEKTPHNFLAGQRCPHCILPTKGEQKIIDYLDNISENYTFQKTFPGLVGVRGGLLSYDFYLCDRNILIEYQGEFHDGTAYGNDCYKFQRQKEHDKRKKCYAEKNGMKLVEIWYWDFENINDILSELLANVA